MATPRSPQAGPTPCPPPAPHTGGLQHLSSCSLEKGLARTPTCPGLWAQPNSKRTATVAHQCMLGPDGGGKGAGTQSGRQVLLLHWLPQGRLPPPAESAQLLCASAWPTFGDTCVTRVRLQQAT